MPTLRTNGIELHYERQGEGPPLLLLAGMASDSASWSPVRDILGERCDLILPDNRCTGRTRPLPCPTGREAMLGDLMALLDRLGLPRVHVAGHSMGGMLALHLAARHPGRVASVTVLSSIGRVGPVARSLFLDLAELYGAPGVPAEAWFRLLFQWLFAPAFFEDRGAVLTAGHAAAAYAEVQPPAGFRAQAAMLAEFEQAPDLSAIACPLHAASGALDLLCPAEAVVATFGAARTTIVPGAAHSLHWEAPEAAAAAILATVARG